MQLRTIQDGNIFWCFMHPKPKACFNLELLRNLNEVSAIMQSSDIGVKYFVLASDVQGIYNLGGDLDLFVNFIKTRDRAGLVDYGIQCIKPLYLNAIGYDRNIHSISLVKGEALGGGFEAALSGQVIIAEKSARMGFPEILFNMYPGMGAINLLSRRIHIKMVEKMILSRKIFTATELFEMGVVDLLVEDGTGEDEVRNYTKIMSRVNNGHMNFLKIRNDLYPLKFQDLVHVVEVWADTALGTTERDICMMNLLVRKQVKLNETTNLIYSK